MKPLALLLAFALTAQAAPFHRKPAQKPTAPAVEPAPVPPAVEPIPAPLPVETPRFTVNPDGSVTRSRQADAELRDWIEGIQREAQAQRDRGDKADAALTFAQAKADTLQRQNDALAKDRNAQAKLKDAAETQRDYWHQKDTEAVKKLWWWRLWAGGAILVGVLLIVGGLLMRFTTWGAKTLGPIVAKV